MPLYFALLVDEEHKRAQVLAVDLDIKKARIQLSDGPEREGWEKRLMPASRLTTLFRRDWEVFV